MDTTRKILFIDNAHGILPETLEQNNFVCDFRVEWTKRQLEEIVGAYFGIVVRSRIKLDALFLEKATQLKFIARYGIGLEHIDLQYANKRNINVFNSPEGSKDVVGEHALGMLLNLLNHIGRSDRQIRTGHWLREPNRGTEIKGRTVGILGYGNTGQAFAKRLSGFEAKVIAYDKYKSNYGDAYAEAVDLPELFEKSDFLSIHIPYDSDNHYFIDKAFLASFKKPIYLINTARGLVLNTADLVQAIELGKVLGAGLDVIEYEETSFVNLSLASLPAPFQYLVNSEQVILTPHIAGWSHTAKKKHAEVLAQKILSFTNSI